MKRSHIVSLALAAVLAGGAVTITGCSSDDNSIIFMNGKTEVVEQFNYIAQQYANESGNTVTVENLESGQEAQIISALGSGGDKAPTIFFMHGPVDYPTYKSYMLDLSSTDLYADLTDKSFAVTDPDDNSVRALPLTVEGYGIIYNKKITDAYFALADKSSAVTVTSMDQIKSYATLKAVCDDMQAHKSELGISGVFAGPSLKSGEEWPWHNHLFNMALYAEYGNLNDVPTDFKFTYNQNMRNIFDLYINDSAYSGDGTSKLINQTVADEMAEIATGKAAMVQNGNWSTSQLSVDGATVKATDCDFLPIYMGDAGSLVQSTQGLAIGTDYHIAINSQVSEKKQKIALDFLDWLLTGDGKSYVTASTDDHGLSFNAPYKAFEDITFDDHLTAQIKEWMGKTTYTNVSWDFISAPSTEVMNKIDDGLTQYVNGGMSDAKWASMVSSVTSQWNSDAAER